MASLMPVAKQQYFIPGTTIPLIGGKLYTYAAGTNTPKTTWQDAAGTVPNTNPITLDSTGSALIFWSGNYKIVLKDALGNTIYTVDNYNTDQAAALQTSLASSSGSSLIGFIQAGVGAVLRTIYAKLLPIVEPEDFGAVGDGVTDDTAAFTKMSTRIREQGGGLIRMGAGKVYYVLPTGGSSQFKLMDLTGCRGVTIQGNGARIKTGDVRTTQYAIYLNAVFGVHIENLFFESGYPVLSSVAGIYWIVANYGAKRISMRNLNFQYGAVGFSVRGAYAGEGVDSNRASGIEAINCHFDSTYYPLNFQGAGDNFFARGIVTRNAGRSYFPFNVHDHDIRINSQQGGPFSDVLLKVYGSTDWYSKLENIKVVYESDGRYPGSGSQSAQEAMIAMDFQLQPTNPGPCTFSNIDITFNVAASAADKNQNVFTIRKYDTTGSPDATGRGHNLIGLKLRGVGTSLQNLVANSLNLFNRAGDNWTGDFVYGVHIHDLFLGNVASQDAVLLNGAPIVGACKLERIQTEGGLALSNTGGKELSIEESSFRNYSAKSRILQSYSVAWTADTTAPNIGAGTLTGYYTSDGKTCTVDIYMKAAADTNFGAGIWHFSLPIPRAVPGYGSTGSAQALDSGTAYYNGTCRVLAGSSVMEIMLGGSPSNFSNAANPITWANQDWFSATITYPIS